MIPFAFVPRLSTLWVGAALIAGWGCVFGAETPAGSLLIECPVACRIAIPALGVSGDQPTDRLHLSPVPAGSYSATFSGFNRLLSHAFTITAGHETHFVVNLAQGKIHDEAGTASSPAPATGPVDPLAGPSFVIADLGLTMIAVAPGSFRMGSETGNRNERPLTQVSITQRYWLGRTEVTQLQWATLMGDNPAKARAPEQPVEQVSWQDAMEFCQRLTQREKAAGRLPVGYFYILPTEALWEYACRAGSAGSSEDELRSVGWYEGNSGDRSYPVGRRPSNAWGFQDMRGNVAEWCFDWLDAYPGGTVPDFAGPVNGAQRVIRGGAFNMIAFCCRATYRTGDEPVKRHPNVGFRLALMAVPGGRK